MTATQAAFLYKKAGKNPRCSTVGSIKRHVEELKAFKRDNGHWPRLGVAGREGKLGMIMDEYRQRKKKAGRRGAKLTGEEVKLFPPFRVIHCKCCGKQPSPP